MHGKFTYQFSETLGCREYQMNNCHNQYEYHSEYSV